MSTQDLIKAVKMNQPLLVEECIQAGMRASDAAYYATAVYIAAKNGHVECLKLCLDAGMRDKDTVYAAARHGHVECVKLLKEYDCKYSTEYDTNT